MKLVIADDQVILAEGLKLLLSQEVDIEVVGLAANGREAVGLAQTLEPDIILMDMQMPVLNGVEAIKAIQQSHPAIKIVILTTFMDDHFIIEGLASGASGYLMKDASPAEIASALRVVMAGGALIEPHVAARLLHYLGHQKNVRAFGQPADTATDKEQLTEREVDISALVAEGLSNIEIAERLFLTEGTVKNNITRILQKLELRDRTHLAIYWLNHLR